MRFHQSVEWGLAVSKIYNKLPSTTTLVLPDLPTIPPDVQEQYWNNTDAFPKLQTVALNRHTPTSLFHRIEFLLQKQGDTGPTHFLIVGGNDQPSNDYSLRTPTAIGIIRDHFENKLELWAVANPNDPSSIETTCAKVEHGASGIVTQPLLASHAVSTLQQYPPNTTLMAGMAFPKTLKGLNFWASLLNPPSSLLSDDPLFQQHVSHFQQQATSNTSLEWAKSQHELLLGLVTDGFIAGIHYMPLHNTKDLLWLLENGTCSQNQTQK